MCLIFSFAIPNKKKFQGEGEYRCIVNKLGEGKAFWNGYLIIHGKVSCANTNGKIYVLCLPDLDIS